MASISESAGGADPSQGPYFSWRDLSYKITVKGDEESGTTKTLLFPQSGFVAAGTMLAVMGPSGAGKSTFLDALAGRKDPKDVEGSISYNDNEIDSLKHISTYVMQDDALIGCLTVKETIMYAGELLFPPEVSAQERMERVDQIIQDFGLQRVQDSRIGNQLIRGISGGEKRRVTLASQLLMQPKIIFLDEPTSGLDSAAAYHVISSIKSMAQKKGLVVIATIHQPSSETYSLFDNLLLLAGGHSLYFGPRVDAPPYFTGKGFPLPPEKNPADHYLGLINVDFMDDKELAKDTANRFIEGWNTSEQKTQVEQRVQGFASSSSKVAKKDREGYPRNILWQTWVLSQRSFKNAYRNLVLFWIRVAMYIALAIMMGTIWLYVGVNQNAIQDRFSALFFSVAFPSFMAVAGIPAFLEDRSTMVRERANGMYSPLAYVLSNTLVSLPFVFLIALAFSVVAYFMIGLHSGADHFFIFVAFIFLALYVAESMVVLVSAIVPIFVVALTVVAFMNGFFMLVQGYFVRKQNLPNFWYYWAHFIDYQTYAFEGLVYSDFNGLTFKCSQTLDGCDCMYPTTVSHLPPSACEFTGRDVLENFGYLYVNVGDWAAILVCMIFIFRFMFGIALWIKKK